MRMNSESKFLCTIIWKCEVPSGDNIVLYRRYQCDNLYTIEKLTTSTTRIPNCHDNAFLDATLDEDQCDIFVLCQALQRPSDIVHFYAKKTPCPWREHNESSDEEARKTICNALKN
jgi:hypothetical protein